MHPPAASGFSRQQPVIYTIDNPLMEIRIDKCLKQQQWSGKMPHPVTRQTLATGRQNARAQIRIMMTGQNQKPRIVHDEPQPVVMDLRDQTNPSVPGRTLQCGRRKTDQCNPPSLVPGHIVQFVTNPPQGATTMMFCHQVIVLCHFIRLHQTQIKLQRIGFRGLGWLVHGGSMRNCNAKVQIVLLFVYILIFRPKQKNALQGLPLALHCRMAPPTMRESRDCHHFGADRMLRGKRCTSDWN